MNSTVTDDNAARPRPGRLATTALALTAAVLPLVGLAAGPQLPRAAASAASAGTGTPCPGGRAVAPGWPADLDRVVDNDITAFVYQWFAWYDRHDDQCLFLAHLADAGLRARYVDVEIRDHQGFRDWYAGVGRQVVSNSHQVRTLRVTRSGPAHYRVVLLVRWQAKLRDGSAADWQVRQRWLLRLTGRGPVVEQLTADRIDG